MDTSVGLIIQVSGVAFITIFLYLLTKTLKSGVLSSWKKGWLSLLIGLIFLQAALAFEGLKTPLLLLFFGGEYIFGFFLVGGCFYLSTGKIFPLKSEYALSALLLITVFFASFAFNQDTYLSVHSFIVGTIVAGALFVLRRSRYKEGLGWWLMQFSLALLTIEFYHRGMYFLFRGRGLFDSMPAIYAVLIPVLDLIFEILLGFGMVIILMERVQFKLREANLTLRETHQKLEELVELDPLTNTLNRHAFYGFLEKNRDKAVEITGCVGFFDIDNMKPINDRPDIRR